MNRNGYEIERKFLIRMPDKAVLERAEMTEIEQVYLRGEEGSTERVRKRSGKSGTVFTHTVKRRISSIRRMEDESEITRGEYEELLSRADESRKPIRKKRYCLDSPDGVWEIDVFPFWSDRAIMELELTDENQRFSLPDGITVIKEVTEDGRYTNSAMARAIPEE